MKTTNDLMGRQFGQLTVIGLCAERYPIGKRSVWLCLCTCGNHVPRENQKLKQSLNGTCHECIPKFLGERKRKHGDARKTELYERWAGMRSRCLCITKDNYRWYGGRGIKICEEWNDFSVFKEWALLSGYSAGLTIERIDPNGNYEPSNCEWITKSENSRRARLN